MNKYTLWYAQKEVKDIQEVLLKTANSVIYFLNGIERGDYDRSHTVYLFTWDEKPKFEEIIITQNLYIIQEFLNKRIKLLDLNGVQSFHLYEYYSYEEAYRQALEMREQNQLCYEPDNKLPSAPLINISFN